MIKLGLLSLSLVIFFSCLFTLALAQTATPIVPDSSPAPIEYSLPYPGILPDHPLYLLKVVRDNILLWLITNPVRKVEFRILLSDKQFNMGLYMLDKNKDELAWKIVAESNHRLFEAEQLLFKIPIVSSSEAGNLKHRLQKSIQKHQQLLIGLKTRTDIEYKDKTDQLLTELENIYQDFNKNK